MGPIKHLKIYLDEMHSGMPFYSTEQNLHNSYSVSSFLSHELWLIFDLSEAAFNHLDWFVWNDIFHFRRDQQTRRDLKYRESFPIPQSPFGFPDYSNKAKKQT